MNNQYDYEMRFEELAKGIDTTFKGVLEPFIYNSISYYYNSKTFFKDMRILDVGCGCGYLTNGIANKFKIAEVEGIDISESAVLFAKAHSNLKFTQQNIVNMNSNKQFDVIVYNMVLHNLLELEETIRVTSNILKPNGIVLITIPHPAFWLSDKIARGKIKLSEPFNYNLEKSYQIPFHIKNGIEHKSRLTYYHRRLDTYFDAFLKYLELARFEEADFTTIARIILRK